MMLYDSMRWMIAKRDRDKQVILSDKQTYWHTYIVFVWLRLLLLPFEEDPAFLKSSAGNQACSHISIAFPSGLPPVFKISIAIIRIRIIYIIVNIELFLPVGVILANNMQDITLDKIQSGFSAGNIRVVGRYVRKMCPHANLNDYTY